MAKKTQKIIRRSPEELAVLLVALFEDRSKNGRIRLSYKDIVTLSGYKRPGSEYFEDTAYILNNEHDLYMYLCDPHVLIEKPLSIKKTAKVSKATVKRYSKRSKAELE